MKAIRIASFLVLVKFLKHFKRHVYPFDSEEYSLPVTLNRLPCFPKMSQKSRRFRLRLQGNRAISEVLGALLLMLVVVIVVATFAYFVSTLQSNSQNRSNYLSNIQNEKLQISNLQLSPNSPEVQYSVYNSTTNYNVKMQSYNSVVLLDSNGVSHKYALTHGYYDSINFSASADIFANGTLAFGYGNCTFRTASWNYANLTIRNLNIQNSALSRVEVNGIWLPYFNETNQNGVVIGDYAWNSAPLQIPAKQSVFVNLNLTSYSIPKNDSLRITLLSSAGNYFSSFYGLPNAFIVQSVNVENSLISERDVPVFDGSRSTANQSSYIDAYIWRVDLPNSSVGAWDGSWADTNHIATVFAYGQTLQYRPEAFFTGSQIVGQLLNITGPFRVSLTVADSYGLLAVSQSLVFTNDPNIAPAGRLSAVEAAGTCDAGSGVPVVITINDVFGRPIPNAYVIITSSSSVTSNVTVSATDVSGQVPACVVNSNSGAGIIEIQSGNLSPLYFTVGSFMTTSSSSSTS